MFTLLLLLLLLLLIVWISPHLHNISTSVHFGQPRTDYILTSGYHIYARRVDRQGQCHSQTKCTSSAEAVWSTVYYSDVRINHVNYCRLPHPETRADSTTRWRFEFLRSIVEWIPNWVWQSERKLLAGQRADPSVDEQRRMQAENWRATGELDRLVLGWVQHVCRGRWEQQLSADSRRVLRQR